MRTLAVASIVLLALVASPLPAADEEAEANATFRALELKIMTAVRDNDVAVLDAILSPRFAWAIAFEGRPHEVMNRAEWIAGGKYIKLESFDVSGLVAETFDRLTLVNFRLSASGKLGTSADVGGPYVVTDLWQMEDKEWKLVRRFLSSPTPLPTKR